MNGLYGQNSKFMRQNTPVSIALFLSNKLRGQASRGEENRVTMETEYRIVGKQNLHC